MRNATITITLLVHLAGAAWGQVDAPCAGDCSGGNVVTVDEILTATSIAVSERTLDSCPAADANGDRRVTVDEILLAISHALEGCPQPVGPVRVTSVHSGKCLEVADASRLPGANIQQGNCTGAPHQRWSFVATGQDHFIVNANSGHCLEVAGASLLDVANLRQGPCADVVHQRWRVARNNLGAYLISSRVSARCMDVAGSSVADGGNVIQFECRGTNNQLWSFPEEALRPETRAQPHSSR